MGLQFETAIAADDDVDEGAECELDGHTLRYYRPTNGQIAWVTAMTEKRKQEQTKIAALIDFFFGLFDQDSQNHLAERLMSREDAFDIDSKGGINDMLDAFIEEWSGRPTQRRSVSTVSPTSTGPSSTPNSPELTSLPSDPIVS